MSTLVLDHLPDTVPDAVREAHENLPPETLASIESVITRQLLELSVIEQYKRADIYLSDAAVALGFYPDIARTMEWLQARGVRIGPSAEQHAQSAKALNALIERRRAALATQHG